MTSDRARLFGLAILPLLLGACSSSGYIDGGDGEPQLATCGDVVTERIDTGAEIDGVEPGSSVGLFVEYQGDGLWQVEATCDTETSGLSCFWDVIVAAEAGIEASDPTDLESDDSLERDGEGVRLAAYTGADLDGFVFSAAPGEPAEIDAFLDGTCHPELVFWVADGEAVKGAPSNPIWLEPSEP